jgi:hypothetical protein
VSGVLANPRLPRRQRLERVAIVVAVVLLGMYLVISPIVSKYFPNRPPAAKSAPPPAKSKSAVSPK